MPSHSLNDQDLAQQSGNPIISRIDLLASEVAKGPPGSAGAAATITVGSTTTGAPGSSASVNNSGSSSAAILDFTVPGSMADAPSDGNTYGRMDAAWVNVLTAVGNYLSANGYFTDAPSDGNKYCRKDGGWVLV